MPSYRGSLSDAQMRALARYVVEGERRRAIARPRRCASRASPRRSAVRRSGAPDNRRAVNELAARVFGSWIRRVDRASVRADLVAGVLGALLVLPQGIAFATLAGLPPEYGLYTAVVPCIVAALFGSSWHVVSGPTNANSLALFATLAPLALVGSPEYIALALAVTVLVGTMQFLIGALRLGTIANFISPAALRGFMGGAAALIAVYALPDLLGLPRADCASPRRARRAPLARSVAVSPAALAVGLFTIAASLLLKRWLPRSPYMLLGLLAATALAFVDRPRARAARSGSTSSAPIPAIWPHFTLPAFDLRLLPDLIGIAFALTIVALGQSISIAKAVAARSGQHIDANREFRGQGLSNIVGGMFSSYVSCGSLNRSFPNFDAGARTPLAAVFASLWLLLLVGGQRDAARADPDGGDRGAAAADLVVAVRRRRAGDSCGASAARTSPSPPRPSSRRSRSASRSRSCSARSCRWSPTSTARRSRRSASWASTARRRRGLSSFAPTSPSRCPSARS